MTVTGIIMECNPFHKGHQYILDTAREISHADYVVVVLSGDYVQRGIPAILDKECRTRRVLQAGADLVLELPLPYATGAADYFARGAIQLLTGLHVVTDLAFGSVCADLSAIRQSASLLSHETPAFQAALRAALAEGMTYAAARARAAEAALGISLPTNGNDLLGIEYVRALNNSSVRVHPIPRIATASATDLRTQMLLEVHDQQETDNGPSYMRANAFSDLLYYRLQSITASSSFDDAAHALTAFQDVDHDLACRIVRLLPEYHSYEDFCALLKTRNVTYTRVSRALLHILLGIRKEDVAAILENGIAGYARVLGFRRSAGALLSRIHENAGVPLITSPRVALESESISPLFKEQLRRDLAASELYDFMANKNRHGNTRVCEYTKQMVMI